MGKTRNKHGPGYTHACRMNGNRGAPRSDVITLTRGPTIVQVFNGMPGPISYWDVTRNGRGVYCPQGFPCICETG